MWSLFVLLCCFFSLDFVWVIQYQVQLLVHKDPSTSWLLLIKICSQRALAITDTFFQDLSLLLCCSFLYEAYCQLCVDFFFFTVSKSKSKLSVVLFVMGEAQTKRPDHDSALFSPSSLSYREPARNAEPSTRMSDALLGMLAERKCLGKGGAKPKLNIAALSCFCRTSDTVVLWLLMNVDRMVEIIESLCERDVIIFIGQTTSATRHTYCRFVDPQGDLQ